jgi:hypothetical protein
MPIDLTQAVLAVGALGSAATGLVDTTKVFAGGMSRAGFGYIGQLIARTVPQENTRIAGNGPGEVAGVQQGNGMTGAGLTTKDILGTLLANWMNGMETGAQKAIAKSFIKLHLNTRTVEVLARETNVDSDQLKNVATKLASMTSLEPSEADAFGRFDLALSALVDQAYERGDQFYRNSCKALAAAFAILLALAGDYSLPGNSLHWILPWWQALIIGLIATPLAPVAKDLANAIQKASDAVRAVKG